MAGPFCSGCGERLRRGARFCDRCGLSTVADGQGVLGGEMYRSTSMAVGQGRIMGALGMAMVGVIMILMGLMFPMPEGPFGETGRAFSTMITIMGLVVLAFSVLIYTIGKRHAEKQ